MGSSAIENENENLRRRRQWWWWGSADRPHEWHGSLFIFILGFQMYFSLRNFYIVLGILFAFQAVGWVTYYFAVTKHAYTMPLWYLIGNLGLNILLVVTGAVLPVVCAWVLDLTSFDGTTPWYWIVEMVIYAIMVILGQSPFYYFLFLPDLMWFFIFIGHQIFDEQKTTIFYMSLWVYQYFIVVVSEFALESPLLAYFLYIIIWVIVLAFYSVYLFDNHHPFSYYLT